MKQEYIDWVRDNVPDYCYGKCAEITLAMAAAFPELKRVRGHVYAGGYKFPHFWLTYGQEIVDPTVSQFYQYGPEIYEPWDDNHPNPTGKCMNCGDYAYDNKACCCDECNEQLMAEYRYDR